MTKAMAGALAAGAFVVGLLVWPASAGLGLTTITNSGTGMAMTHMSQADCPMADGMMSGSAMGLVMSMPCMSGTRDPGPHSHHTSPSPDVTP